MIFLKKAAILSTFLVLNIFDVAMAAPLSTPFIKMEMPPFWNCESNKSGSAWTCQSTVENVKPQAMIVVAARPLEAGQTIDTFFAQLGGTRSFKDIISKVFVTSTNQYTRKIKMSGQEWVDAFHYQSDAVEFQTRHLVTVTDSNSIGIAFSAHKTKWDIFKNDFDAIVKSIQIVPGAVLAVVPENSGDNLPAVNPNVPDGSQLGVFAGVVKNQDGPEKNDNRTPAKSADNPEDDWFLYAALAGAAGIVIFIKRKKASEEESD